MTPERWQKIKEILAAVLDRNVGERLQFLNEACQGDESLEREVRSLVAAYGEAESFLEHPRFRLLSDDPENRWEGAVLDRYRLIRRLGYGGMGTVFLAVDDEFHRQVAVKLLRWQIDEDLVRRFRIERQILARLDHPNIARLYDGGTVEGRPYFVMEYVDGETIDRYCDSRRLSVRDRLELFRTVCSAVHFAHQNLVVHRDLKPSNILVTSEGEPKLLDFGIAKILDPGGSVLTNSTITGLRPMTPDYASPEQIRGDPVATISDVYSLGVVLYELLTGRRPYLLKSYLLEEVVRVVLQEEPERPSTVVTREVERRADDGTRVILSPDAVSELRGEDPRKLRRQLTGDIDNIVLMALNKEPERRYSSAAQLSEDIRRHIEALPVLAGKDTFFYRMGKFTQRNKFVVGTASLVLLLVCTFLVGLFLQQQRTLQERDRAERIAEFLIAIFKISDPSQSRGTTVTAREILDQGAQNVERQLSNQPEDQAAMLSTLGEVYASLGLYSRAEELLTNALEIRRRILAPEHADIADTLDNLASVNALQGRYETAESMYRESLSMFRRVLGDEHPRIAETLSNYGALLVYKGDYKAAEVLLREALVRRRRRGSADAKTAANLSDLASVLRIKGAYREARSLYEEALQLRRSLYGEEHPDVAMTLNNLGLLHKDTGDSLGAKALYLEALRIRRKTLGRNHPQVATSLFNLSSALEDTGDFDAAERTTREALDIARKSLGAEHPLVEKGLSQLANRLRRKGDLYGAEQIFRKALTAQRKLLPARHRDIAINLNNLAIVLQDQGKFSDAERLYRESLRLRRELWGNEHRDVAVALNNLATLFEDMGRWQEAERLQLEALEMRRRLLGNDHPDVLASMGNLATVLSANGRDQEAEVLVRKALKATRQPNSEAHILAAQLRSVLGEILTRQGRFEEAERLLVASYSEIKAGFGASVRPTQKALSRIVSLYKSWGRPEKARRYEALLKG